MEYDLRNRMPRAWNKMCLNLSVANSSNVTDCDSLKLENEAVIPSWSEIGLIIFMILTAVLAISGNSIIILVEMKNLCKTSTDWLVMYMAANDILFAIVNIPIYVIFHSGYWVNIGTDTGCMIHIFVEKVTVFSSTILLCTVAADRYIKTCR